MTASKHRLYHHLQLVAHALKKRADSSLLSAASITTAQSVVLVLIADNEPVNQRFVAEKLSQNESAVTTMVARLELLGFINKRRCTKDGRAWLLEVTEVGRDALSSAKGSFDEINRLIDRSLSSKEVALMADGLKQILKQLEE